MSNRELVEKVNMDILDKNWTDWKWQLKHSIKDIDTFEKLLGIQFDAEERIKLENTLEKFPLSITPYYVSLEKTTVSNDFKHNA